MLEKNRKSDIKISVREKVALGIEHSCFSFQAVALHRSAWIEIPKKYIELKLKVCRTPQECVDRNYRAVSYSGGCDVALHWSAWIEIDFGWRSCSLGV